MANETFTVQGMTCEHCVRAVTEAVSALPGTEAVAVDLATGSVRIDGPVPVDRKALHSAVEEAGYELAAAAS